MAGVNAGPRRPADVDTGFWLWLVALVLLLAGQVFDVFTNPASGAAGSRSAVVLGGAILILAVVGAVTLTLLLLLRSGYRWSRTLLTGGGLATMVYTAASLLSVPRPTASAVVFAVTGIVGSVLIGRGIYLLHRPEPNRFFTR